MNGGGENKIKVRNETIESTVSTGSVTSCSTDLLFQSDPQPYTLRPPLPRLSRLPRDQIVLQDQGDASSDRHLKTARSEHFKYVQILVGFHSMVHEQINHREQ